MKKLLLFFACVAGFTFASCSSETQTVSITPYPNHIKIGHGAFNVKNAPIVLESTADDKTRHAVEEFATQLAAISGGENAVSMGENTSNNGFQFKQDDSLAPEAYKLSVTKHGVEVRAAGFPGFFYAIQTLKQLLPVAIYGATPAPTEGWSVPYVEIDDAPRFGYRGMHMDVARHFFPVEEVKRYIDIMAIHKLNKLHWHLTDDQGWRIEIKRYPELTEVGSIRKRTVIKKDWGNYDNTPYGGFYTQDEIRDIVNYAADRAITIIPEIDLPGHMLAALTAYPQLGCTGGPYEVWGRWGVADDVLCAGNEKIYDFLEGVLTEVTELFPSELIHIGGDECPKVRWEKCPRCQAKIRQLGLKAKDGYSAEHYLQGYVTERIGKFLADRGRRIIGWDEILEGQAPADAVVMSWRGNAGGIKAAQLGHDVIMAPNSYFYFDYYQSADKQNEPFGIGGYVPIEKVYSFDPMEGLSPEEQKHILGAQANLWTEYISTSDHLEYMLLPRLAALSEVQWCQPEVRDWTRFLKDFKMGNIYTVMGYNFAKHIYGIQGSFKSEPEKKCVLMTLTTQGDAPIYYTMDGTDPTSSSTRYTQPVEIRKDCVFKAVALRNDIITPIYSKEFKFSKSSFRPVTMNSAPAAAYTYGAPGTFVDGNRGGQGYTNGSWVGYLDEPFDITIDMKGAAKYSSVEVESLIDKVEWVFPPSLLTVSTSEDGTNFTTVGTVVCPQDAPGLPDDITVFKVEFPETEAPYLRIVANTVNPIPAWHGAAGHPAYMFIGEVAVE